MASEDCSICTKPIKSGKCHHPWHLPFSKWPPAALTALKNLIPVERHERS